MNGSDVGREATYAAEEDAFGGSDLDAETAFDALVASATTMTAGEWWRACGAPAVRVEGATTTARSSSARSSGPAVVVRLATGQRTPGTLTHELAHALAGVAAGHDDAFRAAHIDVVAFLAGADAAGHLARAYAVAGLSIGDRRWPTPIRVSGEGFAIIP